MTQRNLFVIGDSISMHYGSHLAAMTAHRYAYERKTGEEAWLPEAIREQGGNGGDSRAVLAYLQAAQATGALHADILLLNCGLHDIRTNPATGAKQVPIDDYAANLAAMLPLAQAMRRRLVWVRTTPVVETMHNTEGRGFFRFNRDIDAYNAVADKLMTRACVLMADLHALTVSLPGDISADGVHFTEPVRMLQAAFLAGYLAGALPGES
jgi:lysophospholipase L1-like esterase